MAAEQMNAFAAEFGLTPASRARMRFPQSNEEIDPMEELLREVEKGGQ
jgi:phage terminase small subunit